MSAFDTASTLIKKYESCLLHPYLDLRNRWTIGWGNRFLRNDVPVTGETPALTQHQADMLHEAVVVDYMNRIERLVTASEFSDNQLAALTSFAYNEGITAFANSTLLRLLNSGFPQLAASQFDYWIYVDGEPVKGLIRRRTEEKQLFLTEDA